MTIHPKGDNPIRSHSEDRLDRAPVAHAIADDIRRIDASEGFVLALMGPWGSGKTSVVNLVREHLNGDPGIPVVDFNPWMFSGIDALVASFLSELSAQLRQKDSKRYGVVIDGIDKYSEVLTPMVWIPVVGPWAARLKSLVGATKKLKDKNQKSAHELKSDVASALEGLESPIVVVVDDIDRLSSDDIQSMFKLVRLTANFPNVIYLLVFDRERVEKALGEDGMPGRSYLEKIVQAGVDLPSIREGVLLHQLSAALQEVVDGAGDIELFDGARWPDTLMEIIVPLIHTMRDVRRYAASARLAVDSLKERVELGDVLALEAIRVFLPDGFQALVRTQEALTTPSSWGYGKDYEAERRKGQVEALFAAEKDHQDLLRALIDRLFPAALRHVGGSNYGSNWQKVWLKSRRVAHPEVLKLYMERFESPKMRAFGHAEMAFAKASDAGALDEYLRGLPASELEDVVGALGSFEGDYPSEAVVPSVTVLTNLLGQLPERERGMFDVEPRLVVGSVISKILRSVGDEAAIENVVDEIIPNLTSLSGKLEIVGRVGHIDGLGRKLVSIEAARRLESALGQEVRAASDESLAREWDLYRLLYASNRWFDGEARAVNASSDAQFHLSLLRSATSSMRSQSMGARHVNVTKTLSWDSLVEFYGSEDELRKVAKKLTTTATSEAEDAVKLIEKYLGGWRPDRFDSDDDEDE